MPGISRDYPDLQIPEVLHPVYAPKGVNRGFRPLGEQISVEKLFLAWHVPALLPRLQKTMPQQRQIRQLSFS